MISFPSVCVDNFYKDPIAVREFALSLPFDHEHNGNGKYPGVQTKPLHLIAPDFFQSFCSKFFSLYYDFSLKINWVVETRFHKVFPFTPRMDSINHGWMHLDNFDLGAGVVYLNDTPVTDSGTILYDLKDNIDPEPIINKVAPYHQQLFSYTDGNLPNNFDFNGTEQAHKELSNMFDETVRFKNKFNRLIAFDGETYHSSSSTCLENEPFRLVQVFFIKSVSAHTIPMQRLQASQYKY
jgi:hypothetical protein